MLLKEIQNEAAHAGVWFHSWEESADEIEKSWEEKTVYQEFYIDATEAEIRNTISIMRDKGYGAMACGHSHDCCGCWFLSSVSVFTSSSRSCSTDAPGTANKFLIKEVWNRNI